MRSLIAAPLGRPPDRGGGHGRRSPRSARGDQGAQSGRHHARHRDAEHERPEFLEKIMRLRPMPVIMVSTLTGAGRRPPSAPWSSARSIAWPSRRANIPTRSPTWRQGEAPPPARASRAAPRRARAPHRAPTSPTGAWWRSAPRPAGSRPCWRSLRFPANCPPTVITQHMPATFTKSFARAGPAHEAQSPRPRRRAARIRQGLRRARRRTHLEVARGALRVPERDEPVTGHRPSVDVLFKSSASRRGRARSASS